MSAVPTRILLIRLRLIGDVVFTTPLVRALRREYPAAKIVYLVERAAAPVVQHNPHLDDIIIATEDPLAVEPDFAIGPGARLQMIGDRARQLDQVALDVIAAELNGRPRQTLGFKTPSQALAEALR